MEIMHRASSPGDLCSSLSLLGSNRFISLSRQSAGKATSLINPITLPIFLLDTLIYCPHIRSYSNLSAQMVISAASLRHTLIVVCIDQD